MALCCRCSGWRVTWIGFQAARQNRKERRPFVGYWLRSHSWKRSARWPARDRARFEAGALHCSPNRLAAGLHLQDPNRLESACAVGSGKYERRFGQGEGPDAAHACREQTFGSCRQREEVIRPRPRSCGGEANQPRAGGPPVSGILKAAPIE